MHRSKARRNHDEQLDSRALAARKPRIVAAAYGADLGLQTLRIAPFGCKLPTFANLFGIYAGCITPAWPLAWKLLCGKTYSALSSVGNVGF